jgi:inner membrane protein
LGLARLYATQPMPWAYWGLAALLPVVPDLDVFSQYAYGSSLGHRGITHSLVFAAALGIVVAIAAAKRFHVRWWSLAILFFAMIASHGVLDAMTKGGANIAFFWPLGGQWGNWGPLPVSDIALELPDPRHSHAIRAELLWVWLPTLVVVGLTMFCRRHKRGVRLQP